MFKKILVPLNGSALSEQVLPLVKELLNGDAEGAETLQGSVTADVSRGGVAPVLALTPEHSRNNECPATRGWRNGSKPPVASARAGGEP